ncbi:MAG: peptidylprolyl isomerase [Dehalococcoidia bacterium]
MLLRLFATLLALTMFAAACGGDDDDGGDEQAAGDNATEPEGDGTVEGDPCPGDDTEGEGDPVAEGDTITIDYCGTLADGTSFDSGTLDDVVIGETSLIEGFTNALIGMRLGERKTVNIPVAEAYGEPNPDLVHEVPIEQFGQIPEVGSQVSGGGNTGIVVAIGGETITVDFNHALAGEDLTFEIELVEIVEQG